MLWSAWIALWNDDVQIDAEAHRYEENQHHHRRVPERRRQRSPVEVEHRFEKALAEPIEPSVAFAGLATEQHGAHHRGGGQ